jgi:hypothetical protein
MPLKPGVLGQKRGHSRGAIDPEPPDLGLLGPFHPTPQGVGQHLAAETDPEDGDPPAVGHPQKCRLGRDEGGDVLPIHRPVGPKGHDEANIVGKGGPLGCLLTVPGLKDPSVPCETRRNLTTVGIGMVGNDDRAQGGTVILNGVGTNLS